MDVLPKRKGHDMKIRVSVLVFIAAVFIFLVPVDDAYAQLGYISGEGKAELMPSNDTTIRKDYRLVYIE